MRRLGFALTVLIAAAVAFAAPSSAATFGGEVFGAFNTHGMNDVNDAIDAANASGATFDEVSNGLTGGLAVRVWPNANWMIAAGWEPIFLETEDAASSTTMNLDANSFQITGAYFFPTMQPAKWGIGAGLGMYQLAGEIADPSGSAEVEGSGVGFHFMGLGEYTVSPGFAITGGAGYRFADVEIDNTTPTTTADYTGFMGRVGLAFYLPNAN
jgi:hypothetical protein